MAKKLTPKQELYCQSRASGAKKNEAYAMHYKVDNMQQSTVNNNAYQLEKNSEISERISELLVEINDRAMEGVLLTKENVIEQNFTNNRIIEEARRIALSNAKDLYDEYGDLIPIHLLSDEVAATISAVKHTRVVTTNGDNQTETSSIEVKRWDKNSALEKLFKHRGQYREDNTQKNPMMDALAQLPLEERDKIVGRLRLLADTVEKD